jgi:SET domain-containing protein
MTYVLATNEFGRGLYAMRAIKPNTIVMSCEILALNEHATKVIRMTDVNDYLFTFDDERDLDCIVLGDGELFNHSDDSNVSYELVNINGRFMMVFRSTKAIDEDEQLFINYNADVKEPVIVGSDKFTNNLIKVD